MAYGDPVSLTLRVEASGDVARVARESLDVIDKVHRVSNSPRIVVPVVSGGSSVRPGGYEYLRSGEPVRISLSPQSGEPHIDFTHEVGHYIDHQLLGEPGTYASTRSAGVLSQWREAVESTAAYRRLAELGEIRRAQVPQPGGGYGFLPIDRAYVRYLLRPQEIFARSYAQFIATASRNEAFLAELDRLRTIREGYMTYPEQWADDDFQTVREAIGKAIMEA